jgi:hypothetical protein
MISYGPYANLPERGHECREVVKALRAKGVEVVAMVQDPTGSLRKLPFRRQS